MVSFNNKYKNAFTRFYKELFELFVGQSSASIAWGVIVALSVGVIVFITLYYRRSVRNLKTEIAHVQYIADPPTQPDRHHFDNPVYAFQPSTSQPASDSSTLLNNLRSSHKPSNLSRGKFYRDFTNVLTSEYFP